MEWWGPAHRLERVETEPELIFQTFPLQRKGEAAGGMLLGVASFFALAFGQFGLALALAGGSAVGACMWFSTTVRTLVVTETALKGDTNSAAWSEVFEIRYESGGEDGPSGLCARTGLMRSTCVFQDVTEGECSEIQKAIYTKWPSLQMAPRPEGIWSEIKKSLVGGR